MSSLPKVIAGADLRKFMEKRLALSLNGNRQVVGVLRGYDSFMNVVLDNAKEIVGAGGAAEQSDIGMVVIRGNAITMWECIDKVS